VTHSTDASSPMYCSKRVRSVKTKTNPIINRMRISARMPTSVLEILFDNMTMVN
jgi:hypothetical protein